MTAPTRSRLDPVDRRRQIVDAVRPLYLQRPYDQVSLAELAAAAGVTRGLINHHFGSKRELFVEVMRGTIRMPESELPDLCGLPLTERARRTVDWIMNAAETYGQAWVAVSGAANLHGQSDLQAVVDDADDHAARLTLDALGLPDETGRRVRLRTVAPLVKAVCREWLERGTLTRDEALDLITETVLLFATREAS
ncbi:helix-turn-helix domain-containing protein [Aeromicrobium sp. CTD01-1L150]|uniref:TetR/AcrR family transcriptional regulator n=1 Tax=Aeromicrobium sp. CTD01-1L150 TaxID=3341830 RepID=UPI0035BF6612